MKIEEPTKQTDTAKQTWLDNEIAEQQSKSSIPEGERLPALKFEPKKITEITIDPTKPFVKWNTTNTKGQNVTKAIVKVIHNKEDKIWWLNIRNPIYREILQGLKNGRTNFKIFQTGTQADTKYELIE